MCLLCFLPRFLELAAELREIDAVLRGFVSADENNRNIPAIFLGQFGIQIDIHLAQWSVEFAEQWSNGGFGVVAQVAAGPRVQRNLQWGSASESRSFRGNAHGFGAGERPCINTSREGSLIVSPGKRIKSPTKICILQKRGMHGTRSRFHG